MKAVIYKNKDQNYVIEIIRKQYNQNIYQNNVIKIVIKSLKKY